jgi:hypothetical protein
VILGIPLALHIVNVKGGEGVLQRFLDWLKDCWIDGNLNVKVEATE